MPKYNALSWGWIVRTDYVLFWNCSSCGEKAAFLDAHCTNCNNPFDSQELSKISDKDFQEVTDPKVIFMTQEMMWWFCSHCTGYNRNLKKSDYDSWRYLKPDFECSCLDCGNGFDGTEQDWDYIVRNGPNASSKVWAVRAMIQHNINIRKRIHARKTWRIIANNLPPLRSKQLSHIWKTHRWQVANILEKKYPKLYLWLWWSVTILAAFLAYKWFENYETTITMQWKDWERSLYIESVQTVNKSWWLENVDNSDHQNNPFHNYQVRSTFYAATGREDYNHNPNYCRLVPDSEPEIQDYSCRSVTSESCSASSGWGLSCIETTSKVCDVPVWWTRYFDSEECQKVRYTIHDWAFDRNITSPSLWGEDSSPYWPEFTPEGDNFSLWSEREVTKKRDQTYTIHVSYDNNEKEDSLDIPEDLWETLYDWLQCPAEADFINWVDLDTIDWEGCWNLLQLWVSLPYFEIIKRFMK